MKYNRLIWDANPTHSMSYVSFSSLFFLFSIYVNKKWTEENQFICAMHVMHPRNTFTQDALIYKNICHILLHRKYLKKKNEKKYKNQNENEKRQIGTRNWTKMLIECMSILCIYKREKHGFTAFARLWSITHRLRCHRFILSIFLALFVSISCSYFFSNYFSPFLPYIVWQERWRSSHNVLCFCISYTIFVCSRF